MNMELSARFTIPSMKVGETVFGAKRNFIVDASHRRTYIYWRMLAALSAQTALGMKLMHQLIKRPPRSFPPNVRNKSQICAPSLALPSPPRVQQHQLGSQITKESNSIVNFLFSKVLTARDANPFLGCLVIPKRCAEIYFPKISEPQETPIKFLDKERKEWEFRYCFRPNRVRGNYTLEGTGSFLVSTNAQPHDRVKFFSEVPEGKLMITVSKSPPSEE
ncbi:B3 domain-containing protein [Tripterygium wilfordii]|uniref:B3 domain-containing protein n=1 Tax=Tripterygium wilfordii TaxID=458696 RepID=A0A7J7C9L8_TRIWF|nr:B3 domain-containing protein [Tripterygium wilfordii]